MFNYKYNFMDIVPDLFRQWHKKEHSNSDAPKNIQAFSVQNRLLCRIILHRRDNLLSQCKLCSGTKTRGGEFISAGGVSRQSSKDKLLVPLDKRGFKAHTWRSWASATARDGEDRSYGEDQPRAKSAVEVNINIHYHNQSLRTFIARILSLRLFPWFLKRVLVTED